MIILKFNVLMPYVRLAEQPMVWKYYFLDFSSFLRFDLCALFDTPFLTGFEPRSLR